MSLLTFQVTGTANALKGVTTILANLNDLTPFWRDIFAPKYFSVVQDMFSTSGTPRGAGGRFIGGPWARLSPLYAAWKAKHAPGRPILTLSGRLRESLRYDNGALGPEGYFAATPTYLIAGTTVPYGKYHQTGTSKMPQRNFLPEPDMAVFGPLLQQWLMKTQQG